MSDKRFRKCERLCSKRLIAALFESGKEFRVSPFRVIYSLGEYSGVPACLMVSVPKRNHKRAVRRNLLKRRIREAYRLNKGLLDAACASGGFTVNIIVVYVSQRVAEYAKIEDRLAEALSSLADRVSKDCDFSAGVVD